MKYIFITKNGFGFKMDGINEILPTDIQISDVVYNRFFELQSQGKQFRIRNINGTTFEEIFEDIIPIPAEPQPQIPSMEDRIAAVEEALLNMI